MIRLCCCAMVIALGHAAITLVQPASGSGTCPAGTCSGGGTGSKSVTLSSTPTVGNTLVIGFESVNFAQCTDNQSPANTYVGQSSRQGGGNTSATVMFAKVVTASGTFTVTCNNVGSSHTTLIVSEWSGLSQFADAVSWGSGLSGANYNCGSFTTLNANDLLVDFESDDGSSSGGTFTPGTSFTMLAGSNNASGSDTAGMEYRIVSATATYTPNPTYTSKTSNSSCLAMAIKQTTSVFSGSPALVQHTTGTSSSETFGATPTVGNVVIVGVAGTLQDVACKDNQTPSNPYVGLAKSITAPTTLSSVFVAPVATASGTFTVTCTAGGGGSFAVHISEWSGVVPQVDVGSSGTGSTPYACGTFTTNNANDVLFATAEDTSNATNPANVTAGSGFTLIDVQNNGSLGSKVSGIEREIVNSATSYSPTMSSTGQTAANTCTSLALQAGSLIQTTHNMPPAIF